MFNRGKNQDENSGQANLTLKVPSMLDTEDLWCVPGKAADTLQPVQVILVEDLQRAHNNTYELSGCLYCNW